MNGHIFSLFFSTFLYWFQTCYLQRPVGISKWGATAPFSDYGNRQTRKTSTNGGNELTDEKTRGLYECRLTWSQSSVRWEVFWVRTWRWVEGRKALMLKSGLRVLTPLGAAGSWEWICSDRCNIQQALNCTSNTVSCINILVLCTSQNMRMKERDLKSLQRSVYDKLQLFGF